MNKQSDKKLKEFDQFRNIYISNILNREYPTLPAYYYYMVHTSKINILSQNEFDRMFIKAVSGFQHPITLDYNPPVMELEQIYQQLDEYYNVQYLLDSEGKLVKMV